MDSDGYAGWHIWYINTHGIFGKSTQVAHLVYEVVLLMLKSHVAYPQVLSNIVTHQRVLSNIVTHQRVLHIVTYLQRIVMYESCDISKSHVNHLIESRHTICT